MISLRSVGVGVASTDLAEAKRIWNSEGFTLIDISVAIKRFNRGLPYKGLRRSDMYPGRGGHAGEIGEAVRQIVTLWPYALGLAATGYFGAAGVAAWSVSVRAVKAAMQKMVGRSSPKATVELVLPRGAERLTFDFDEVELDSVDEAVDAMIRTYNSIAATERKRRGTVYLAYEFDAHSMRWRGTEPSVPTGVVWARHHAKISTPSSHGDAVDMEATSLADWQPYVPGGIPSEGDLVIWDTRLPGLRYGHTAIAMAGSTADELECFSSNWPAGSPAEVCRFTYEGVSGWWHLRKRPS